MRALVKTSLLLLLAMAGTALIPDAQAQLTKIYGVTNVWRYNIACQDGTGWETAAFDDSSWSFGPGGFTGGETLAGLLPELNTRSLPAPNANGALGHANYFRTHFNIASTAGISLVFSNAVDDAAVFYLNGTRVFDLRVTANPAVCTTFGGGAPATGTEAQLWEVTTLSEAQLAGILQVGDNVLAVSVHQVNNTSSDLVFANALMQASTSPPNINYAASSLTNRSVAQCVGSTTLNVSATGFPSPTYQWYHDNNPILDATNATYAINNATTADGGSYYVAVSNTQGTVNTTPNTVVTVIPDTAPPVVLSTVVSNDLTHIRVTFNETIHVNLDLLGTISLADTNTGAVVDLSGLTFEGSAIVLETAGLLDATHGYALQLEFVVDECPAPNYNEMPLTIVKPTFNVELIGFNANNVWKYATNVFGSGWETVGYDDSLWESGEAGFGRDATPNGVDIRTPAYPNSDGTPYFFRRHFFLPSSTNGVTLSIRHVFEDGAVIFVNGQEAGRYQVAAGVLTAATLSTGALADPTPISAFVPLSTTGLVSGDNVIAVILLQSSATSTDMEMAMELTANIPKVSSGPPIVTVQPQSQTVTEGANVTFTVSVDGAIPITYQWRKGTTPIIGATNASYTITGVTPGAAGSYNVLITNSVSNAASTPATLIVNADLTSPVFVSAVGSTNLTNITLIITDGSGLNQASVENVAHYSVHLTSGGGAATISSATLVNSSNILLTTSARTAGQNYTIDLNNITDRAAAANLVAPATRPVQATIVLFSFNQVWRYDQSGADLGTTWKDVAYNDSAWPSGAGFLAFEDSVAPLTLFTNLAGGSGTNTSLSLTNLGGIAGRTITYYFRTSIGSLPFDPTAPGNAVRAVSYIDDGAVIYVNGAEAMRFSLTNTPGVANYTNFAFVGSTEGAGGLITSNPLGFAQANNVIAAEVHQNNVTSSDIAWGMQLEGLVTTFGSSGPTLHVSKAGNLVTITWAGGGTLYRSINLNSPANWVAIPGAASPFVTNTTATANQFFGIRP